MVEHARGGDGYSRIRCCGRGAIVSPIAVYAGTLTPSVVATSAPSLTPKPSVLCHVSLVSCYFMLINSSGQF